MYSDIILFPSPYVNTLVSFDCLVISMLSFRYRLGEAISECITDVRFDSCISLIMDVSLDLKTLRVRLELPRV